MASTLNLKQFRQEGCLSYAVIDVATRVVAMIDPNHELLEDYRAFLAERGLKLVLALDTHLHADHFSGTQALRQEYGCEIGMAAGTPSVRVTRKLVDGDRLAVGGLSLKVLATPGHTPDSLCFHLDLAGQGSVPGLVFTGDTLFIGSTGRTDFPGADPLAQWRSLHEILGALPGGTLVYPGHDYNGLLFSTIDVEKRRNPHWLLASKELFVDLKERERIPNPGDEIRKRIEFNRRAESGTGPAQSHGAATACGTAGASTERVTVISVDKYKAKLAESAPGTIFLDVREPDEFAGERIPGTTNLPLSDLGLRLPELAMASRIYLSCQSGGRSTRAAQTLAYLGIHQAVDVSGGLTAWKKAGL